VIYRFNRPCGPVDLLKINMAEGKQMYKSSMSSNGVNYFV